MTEVKVTKDRYTTNSLYQYDYNQDLAIYGLSLPSIPEIHFANAVLKEAIVKQATMDSAGVVRVDIPNEILTYPNDIDVYVCIYEGDAFRVLYKLTIPINAKKKPADYITPDDEKIYSYNALENKLENTIELSLANYDEVNQKYEAVNEKYGEAINIFNESTKNYNKATENLSKGIKDVNDSLDDHLVKVDNFVGGKLEEAKSKYDSANSALSSANENYNQAVETLTEAEEILDESANKYIEAYDMISQNNQVGPLFAQTIEECTDNTKVYVLPDGYIYAYMYTEEYVNSHTNLADPTSSDWKDGYRISSSGISALGGKSVNNPITCKIDDVIRIQGVSFEASVDRFQLSGVRISDNLPLDLRNYISNLPLDYLDYNLTSDGVHEFTILSNVANAGLTSETLEFCCAFNTPTDPSSIIITKNEEIGGEPTIVKKYKWTNTGRAFVPTNYENRILDLERETETNAIEMVTLKERMDDFENSDIETELPEHWLTAIETVKEKIDTIRASGGVNCINFVWTSDIHAKKSNDEKGKRLGLVVKEIMDKTDIPLFISTGDLMSQSSYADSSDTIKELELAKSWLEPIPYYQQALIMGNHDGAWGDASGYYYKQLPIDVMYNLIYRKQSMDLRRVSGDNGTYYYLDNMSQKMRFIFLNSNNTPNDDTNSDGTAVCDRFHASCYGQTQLDWLTNIALDMPDGYSACIFAHEPYPGDWSQTVGIVDAYNRRGSYSNTYTDANNTWRNSTVNVNFSDVNGEIVAVFAGHVHYDFMRYTGHNPMYSTCPLITITTSLGGDPRQSPDGEELPTRTDGTATEFAIDIVTVDTKNKMIYLTRLGAGNDRLVNY